MAWLDRVPWWLVTAAVLTLGLAPYLPEPHVWEKLKLLFLGGLRKPIDMFDLGLHGLPWVIAAAQVVRTVKVW